MPELLDISKEPQRVLDAYGVKLGPKASFAHQRLLAGRASKAGMRFVKIYHGGWDRRDNLHKGLVDRCGSIVRPVAALLADLE